MSIAKAVISGTVYRNPEKRYTGNNIPVSSFTLNIDEKDPSLIRVVARGNLAETVENAISKNDKIVAEGRLQIASFQAEDGTEKKVMELDLSSFEVISSNAPAPQKAAENQQSEVVKFAEVEPEDILIGEEEIPF